jgi:hypothetical protein
MSEQSGHGEPADRSGSGQPRGTDRSGSRRSQQPGRRQPGTDVLSDLQRWLIRSSARSMRNQFEDQVRRTLSGQRPDNGDVWDIATTEIPPEVGEAPECQWCPICRAARRMRDSRSGLADQLTGAGEAVAAAVQDAARTFDTFLGRAAGGSAPGGRPHSTADQAGDRAHGGTTEPDADPLRPPGQGDTAGRPDSLAGGHGPVGWKPGDRLATAGAAVADPWATATAPGEPAEGATSDGGTAEGGTADGGTADGGTADSSRSSGSSTSGGPDGRGHGPGDRG